MALGGVSIIAWDSISGGNLIGILVSLMVPLAFVGSSTCTGTNCPVW